MIHRNTPNVSFKVKLGERVGNKYILVQINGELEKLIEDESLSKEQLAEKPQKFMT